MSDQLGRDTARKIQPLDSRLLVQLDDAERKFGSIVIPRGTAQKLDIVVSKVLARGLAVKTKKWELAEGDFVIHVRTAALKYDGVLGKLGTKDVGGTVAFVWEKDLIAVVDPKAVVEGSAQFSEGRYGEWHQ